MVARLALEGDDPPHSRVAALYPAENGVIGIKLRFMGGSPATGPATYEDLRRVPDHLVAEIVDGELITSGLTR
jgi:hypothetical protein